MNSKDFYPDTIKTITQKLGCSEATVWNYLKRVTLTQVEATYIGNTQHFMPSVIEKLKEAGCGVQKWAPKPAKEFNGYVVEKNIPYTVSTSGVDKYPFHMLDIGESFAKPGSGKNSLQREMTDAHREYKGKKFRRRFYKDTQTVRVWRIE